MKRFYTEMPIQNSMKRMNTDDQGPLPHARQHRINYKEVCQTQAKYTF